MKLISIFCATVAFSSSAFAYREGAYSCKNIQNLPNNSYKVTSVALPGSSSTKVPFLEITRYYSSGEAGAEVHQVQSSGFATVIKADGVETLMLGAIELEFQNGELANCKN
jgi:hypothetical protein